MTPFSDVVIKKSYLSVLRDPSTSNWERHFYSLRRPYLYIYASSSETDIQSVINVETVRVETSKEILDLAGKKNVFALYTPQVRLLCCKGDADYQTELLLCSSRECQSHDSMDAGKSSPLVFLNALLT